MTSLIDWLRRQAASAADRVGSTLARAKQWAARMTDMPHRHA